MGGKEFPHCEPGALTDSYGLIIQGILAILAFFSLVVKRFLEPPLVRRPWVVWVFDTSKQGAGAAVIHMMNIFLADSFSGDPCTWYVVSFLLDSSLGLLLIYICVKLVNCLANWKNWPTLRFGEYGKPPSCRPWFHQCMVFIGITVFEKLVITITIQFKFWKEVRKVILSPITSPRVEVTLVMLVIPFLVNTLMFWAVDNFTKRKPLPNSNTTSSGGMMKSSSAEVLGIGGSSSSLIHRESESCLLPRQPRKGLAEREANSNMEDSVDELERLLDNPTAADEHSAETMTNLEDLNDDHNIHVSQPETRNLILRHNSVPSS